MQVLHFNRVFSDRVRAGDKCITLRYPRKNPFKKGEDLGLFEPFSATEHTPIPLEKHGNTNETKVLNDPFYLVLDGISTGFGYTYDPVAEWVTDLQKFQKRGFEHNDYLERIQKLDGFDDWMQFQSYFKQEMCGGSYVPLVLQLIQFAPCPKVEALLKELKNFYG